MSESIVWICGLGSYRRSTVAAAAAAVATALRSAAVRQTSSPARKTSPLSLLKKNQTRRYFDKKRSIKIEQVISSWSGSTKYKKQRDLASEARHGWQWL